MGSGGLANMLHRLLRRRWSDAANAAPQMVLSDLRMRAGQARQLRRDLDRLLFVADERLAMPVIGNQNFRRPVGTDWAWRPDLWRGRLARPGVAAAPDRTRLNGEVALFHDCPLQEITLRQLRNTAQTDLAAYALRIDVLRFGGGFLSIVVDLPQEALDGLTRAHLFRLDTLIELERSQPVTARLNIQHGPNTAQLALGLNDGIAEFDLAETGLHENRIEKAWIDLIFERPAMNQIIIRDLTVTRAPRAAL